jgi:uncharacterized membrane protein
MVQIRAFFPRKLEKSKEGDMTNDPNQAAGKLQLSWDDEHIQIAPGSSKTIRLAITNLGAERAYFELSVKGVPGEWVALDTPVVELGAGGQGDVELIVTVPEPPQGRAGRYPLVVEVASQGDPGVTATLSGELTVAAFQSEGRVGLLLAATQFAVAPGGSVTFPLLLHNRGLTADTFRLGVEGIPTAWISTADAQTHLEPGEHKEIALTIQPPRAAESGAGRRPFIIKVQSQETPEQEATA